MTSSEYPLLVLPSHEMYQLAHIATFIADCLARHRHAAAGRTARAEAIRDLVGGMTALDAAEGLTQPRSTAEVPQPIDTQTFNAARGLLNAGPRWADAVSLSATGDTGWAVVGHVPGVGPVGAKVDSPHVADALRQHFLTQPAAALGAWAVTDRATPIPPVPDSVDLAAFVENLNPAHADARAVARHLRGLSRRTDAAIRGRFAGVDLDAPLVVAAPVSSPVASVAGGVEASSDAAVAKQVPAENAPTGTTEGKQRRGRPAARAETGFRHLCGVGPQPATTAAKVPTINAGP